MDVQPPPDPQDPGTPPDPLELLRKLNLDVADLERHVFLPDHLRDATEKVFLPTLDSPFRRKISSIFSFLYWLNTDKFAKRLHEIVSPCVMGYSLELRQSGTVVFTKQWQSAKSTADGKVDWTRDTALHLASVSKLVTAIALTRLLDRLRISYDEPIAHWLPQYWTRGVNVDAVTFRHVMSHRSGFFARQFPGVAGPVDYQGMKDAIALGTLDIGMRDYKNINYSLCRVLLATLKGDVHPAMLANAATAGPLAPFFGVRDAVWDTLTTNSYQQYVNDRVFAPANVDPRAFTHEDDCALAYRSATDPDNGWNTGDVKAASGAIGWHLSVREMLRVMAAFRRAGTIMPSWRAQRMLESDFGVDAIHASTLGTVFGKGGWWESNEGKVEQSNAFMLPRSMELAILANSPCCKPSRAFFDRVIKAIDECIEPWIAALWR